MISNKNWCILPFPFSNLLRYFLHVARLSINGLLGMWLGLLAFYFSSPERFPEKFSSAAALMYVYYQCVCSAKSTVNPGVYIKKVKVILVVS